MDLQSLRRPVRVSLIPMAIGGAVLSRLRDQEAVPLRQIARRALARIPGSAQARRRHQGIE